MCTSNEAPIVDNKSPFDHLEQLETKTESIQQNVSEREQSHLRRYFDRCMLPVVCILYVLSYLDRGNIGNAKTAGADVDLGLDSSQWTWVLNTFYITYVCFEWTVLLWKLLPAQIYVACLCLGWGILAMSTGATQSMAGICVVRGLLGIFEASFGVGAPYYLSLFYQRTELALRVSLLLEMSPLANCFAGALAYGITHQSRHSAMEVVVHYWYVKHSRPPQTMFQKLKLTTKLTEGLPTVLFSPVVFFFLPDGPGQAKFLSEDEQTLAIERLQTRDRTAKNKVQWAQFFSGLRDYRNVVHMLIHFMCNYSFAGLSNFLPTITKGLGYSSIDAQGLTAPVYCASFLLCIAAAFVSNRYGKGGFIVAAFATMGCIENLLLATIQDNTKTGARYCGIWLAVCGIFPALAINITWLLNNNGGDSKRGAGLAVRATFGQPYYVKGCAIGCGFTGAIVILALGLVFTLHSEDKEKDRRYGTVDGLGQLDISAEGDKHPQFSYLLWKGTNDHSRLS